MREPVRQGPTRRTVLAVDTAATAAIGLAAVPAPRARATPVSDPFLLGIASGDPAPDGFVLWPRLAPEPLAEDGKGGVPDLVLDVAREITTEERFRRIVRRGAEQAAPEIGHSAHVEVAGLEPAREHFYRFGNHISRPGRTRTTPAAGTPSSAPTMCSASCARWERGFFTTYRRMAEDHPDLVLHLGDYPYEHGHLGYPVDSGVARKIEGGETRTLANYRQRHARTKADPDPQFARSPAPWLVP